MACRLASAKPLSEPMLEYCQLHLCEQTSVKSWSKFMHFHSIKYIWQCHLELAAILSRPHCVNSLTLGQSSQSQWSNHEEYQKTRWRHQMETFPAFLALCAGIHWSPVNSPHKGRGALMFIWSAPWINGWVNNREAGDLRRHRAHYDVIVMNASWIHTNWWQLGISKFWPFRYWCTSLHGMRRL